MKIATKLFKLIQEPDKTAQDEPVIAEKGEKAGKEQEDIVSVKDEYPGFKKISQLPVTPLINGNRVTGIRYEGSDAADKVMVTGAPVAEFMGRKMQDSHFRIATHSGPDDVMVSAECTKPVEIDLGRDNDHFSAVGSEVPTLVHAGHGHDVLRGGNDVDRFFGGTGNDTFLVQRDSRIESKTRYDICEGGRGSDKYRIGIHDKVIERPEDDPEGKDRDSVFLHVDNDKAMNSMMDGWVNKNASPEEHQARLVQIDGFLKKYGSGGNIEHFEIELRGPHGEGEIERAVTLDMVPHDKINDYEADLIYSGLPNNTSLVVKEKDVKGR